MNEGRCTDCLKRDVPVFQFSDGSKCRECYLKFFGEADSFDAIVRTNEPVPLERFFKSATFGPGRPYRDEP